MTALVPFSEKQLALIRKTVAKDCNPDEFDWAMAICKATRLDPLRRQIYFFVFNKTDAAKRQMVPVVAIGGYRAIAERTGNYRPGRTETFFGAAQNADTNPLGISHATATVYKFSHGDWHPIEATAYWEEFAPIKTEIEGGFRWEDTGEFWPDSGKPKRRKVPIDPNAEQKPMLDPGKEGWRRMPRVMIEKCAEALALRKAWPDDFAGLYGEGELDQAEALDITPSEMADTADKTARMARIGGPALIVDWMDGSELQRVPVGRFGDAAMAFIREHTKPGAEEIDTVRAWRERNAQVLKEYWAHDKDGALTLKEALEKLPAMAAE